MKVIKLKLNDETAWLAGIHPSKRVELIKYALKKLSSEEIMSFLGNFEKGKKEENQAAKKLQDFENW